MTLSTPLVSKPSWDDPFATWGGAWLNSPGGWLLGQGNSHECVYSCRHEPFLSVLWVDPNVESQQDDPYLVLGLCHTVQQQLHLLESQQPKGSCSPQLCQHVAPHPKFILWKF